MPSASRSSSKTPILILVTVLVVAVVAVGAYVYINKLLGAPSVDELVELMPEDSTAVFLVRGIPELAMDFELEELFQTLREENADFREELQEAEEELGFDPTDRQALQEHGLDVMSPLGASVRASGDPENPDVQAAFFVPTSDAEALDALIRRMAEKENMTLQDLEAVEGTAVTASADGATQYAFRNDYLVVAVSDEQAQTSAYLQKILTDTTPSVTTAGWFQDQSELVSDDWKMLVLANLDFLGPAFGNMMSEMQPGAPFAGVMQQLEDLASLGVAFDLDPDHFRFAYRVTAVENPTYPFDAAAGDPEDQLVEEIPGKALSAMRLAVDLDKVLDQLEGHSPDIAEMLQQAYETARSMNIDLENGVIPALGSPISLAVLEDSGQVPVGGALWLPLRTDHDMEATLATLQGLINGMGMEVGEDVVGETTWYTLTAGPASSRWGIARDHFVVAFGQETSPAVAEAMADGSGSFLDSIEHSVVVDGLQSEGDGFFFLDIPAVITVVEKVAGEGNVPEEARPFLDNLGVMWSRSESQPTVAVSELRLLAAQPEGFAKMLKAAVEQSVEDQ